MEITLVQTIGVKVHTPLQLRLDLVGQAHMQYQVTARLYERCVFAETLHVCLICAVNIKMVGINGGNDRAQRSQMVERTVKLIGLNNHAAAPVAYHQIALNILKYTTQERIAALIRTVQNISQHG